MIGEVVIAGHSLGGAHAYQYAYSRVVRGLRVDGVYLFAPPNPGNSTIGKVLAPLPLIRSFKNGRDIVPDVPVDIQWAGEEYVQPRPFEELAERPLPGAGFFGWHNIDLYVRGVHALPNNSGASITPSDAVDQVALLYKTNDGWDWINPVNGVWWAMRIMPNGARLMIPRGSVTGLDWLDDFDFAQIPVMGAKFSRGFWAGVEPVQDTLDAQLAPNPVAGRI